MEESLLLPPLKSSTATSSDVFITEVKTLGYLAAPMVSVILSQYLLQVISVMMVGHLGELALSSTAIAISLAGVTGFSLLLNPLYRIDAGWCFYVYIQLS
ncbi:hypothetical protein Pint_22179 [Pistacia integerrima]|uniref:Uncharacterized protein n=1 Tax=Pistacia integerrima TaxID=434235 RepID=A0ACC0YIZ7_9ROSI|nr:hypothetical protein Pint_22179 [Pistacia integerrima]